MKILGGFLDHSMIISSVCLRNKSSSNNQTTPRPLAFFFVIIMWKTDMIFLALSANFLLYTNILLSLKLWPVGFI